MATRYISRTEQLISALRAGDAIRIRKGGRGEPFAFDTVAEINARFITTSKGMKFAVSTGREWGAGDRSGVDCIDLDTSEEDARAKNAQHNLNWAERAVVNRMESAIKALPEQARRIVNEAVVGILVGLLAEDPSALGNATGDVQAISAELESIAKYRPLVEAYYVRLAEKRRRLEGESE